MEEKESKKDEINVEITMEDATVCAFTWDK